jgi:outer membrane murein-binding lipoprotein Lpp
MMRRVGELKAEVERLKKFNEEAMAHIAKEERKSRERLDMEQADNARLKAEVHRLEEIVGSDAIDKKYGMCCDASAQVERLTTLVESNLNQSKLAMAKSDASVRTLEAQVERLTKAGDAMASSIQFNEEMAQDYNGPTIVHQSVQRWNAAKEGKGQP